MAETQNDGTWLGGDRAKNTHARHTAHARLDGPWGSFLERPVVLPVTNPSSDSSNRRNLRFPRKTEFIKVLTRRVNDHFAPEQSKAGGVQLLKKAGLIGLWTLASYLWMVFFAHSLVSVILAGLSLATAIAGIGFCIQHDGGHASFSDDPRINKWAARTLDLIGGSSWIWKSKHNYLHHYFTNVDGVDADLQDGTFMRLSPLQKHRSVHRFQHIYAWFLYGLLPIKWHFMDDFANLKSQKVGEQSIRLDDRNEIRVMLWGKVIFFAWALALPIAVNGWAAALAGYVFVSFCLGIVLAVVFQLAHCVPDATFLPQPSTGEQFPNAWAEHQLRTTVNFAPRSRFWTWYLGGLNYQIEHHLFPKISHIHYPQLAPIVKTTCQEFEVPYNCEPTVSSAVLAHYRFLKTLSRA